MENLCISMEDERKLYFFCPAVDSPLDSPGKACYHSAHGDDGKSSLPARPSQRAAGAGKAAGPGK